MNSAMRNRMRAAAAWYGEFSEKLTQFPMATAGGPMPQFGSGAPMPWFGDISNIRRVHDELQCKPFAWFLRRFQVVYVEGGLIPAQTFLIRDDSSQLCLEYLGPAGTSPNGHGRAELR